MESIIGVNQIQLWDLYSAISNEVDTIKLGRPPVLSTYTELILTLLWLRQNMSYRVLSWIFDVGKSTVAEIISDVIDIIFEKAEDNIFLPPRVIRDAECATLFGKQISLVLDGAEQQVNGSKNEQLSKFLFSGKKRKYTFTKLVGVGPYGGIWFLSLSFAGSLNDLNLLQLPEGNISSYLDSDEYVLADKGFRGMRSTYRVISATQNCNKQQRREICRKRVIVENSIGHIREWKVCKGLFRGSHVQPGKDLREWHHKIWMVCAYLVNKYRGSVR
jgi:hypothetical protein